MHAAYPTGSELADYLANLGMALPSGLDTDAKATSAATTLEEKLGWYPALSTGIDEARSFDPPGPPRSRQGNFLGGIGGGVELDLDGGLLTIASVVCSGSTFERGTQFWLRPDNAPAKGRPYTSIDFVVPLWGTQQSVVVTGKWGRYLQVPDDVWQAVLGYGAYLCAPEISANISRGVNQIEDRDYKVRFGIGQDTGPLANEKAQWLAAWTELIRNGGYRRVMM